MFYMLYKRSPTREKILCTYKYTLSQSHTKILHLFGANSIENELCWQQVGTSSSSAAAATAEVVLMMGKHNTSSMCVCVSWSLQYGVWAPTQTLTHTNWALWAITAPVTRWSISLTARKMIERAMFVARVCVRLNLTQKSQHKKNCPTTKITLLASTDASRFNCYRRAFCAHAAPTKTQWNRIAYLLPMARAVIQTRHRQHPFDIIDWSTRNMQKLNRKLAEVAWFRSRLLITIRLMNNLLIFRLFHRQKTILFIGHVVWCRM